MNTIIAEVTHGIVNRITGSFFNYQAWPTVARDENGTLYAVASGFRMRHVCPFGKTVMYISRDGGKTWSPPMVINDTYLDDRDAGILYLGKGKLLVSWFTRAAAYEYTEEKRARLAANLHPGALLAYNGMMDAYQHLTAEETRIGSYVRVSEDYGTTWGPVTELPVTAPHGPCRCKDGTLLYLGNHHKMVGAPGDSAVKLYRSRDDGKTWEFVCQPNNRPPWLQPGENFCEPHILELPDGRLLGAVRVQGRDPYSIATAFSGDGGQTWSEFVCTDVSGSPPHLVLHSSGALICTYGRREPPYSQRAMVSYDLGRTWTEEYILDDRSVVTDLGYGSTVELDDGSLFSVYYQKMPGDDHCSIGYAKWRLNPRG